jgi:hypothetical protein
MSVPGGLGLLIDMLARVPGAKVVSVRQGWTGKHTSIEIGNYRFSATKDGRLQVGHAVNDVVLSTQELHAGPAGAKVVEAVRQQVANFGPSVMPDVEAITEGLRAAGR